MYLLDMRAPGRAALSLYHKIADWTRPGVKGMLVSPWTASVKFCTTVQHTKHVEESNGSRICSWSDCKCIYGVS